MTDQGLIILKRDKGPAAGLMQVTIDAPGWKQAEVVIEERFANTPDEEFMLRRILEERRNTDVALRMEDV